MNARWVATISDGTVATELEGEWTIIPGERKPWVRLCQKLHQEGTWITSLRLNVNGQTIHLPRQNNKFESEPPLYYDVCYHAEIDDIFGDRTQKDYVDIGAFYDTFSVHYIHEIGNNNAWVTINKKPALNPSPERK